MDGGEGMARALGNDPRLARAEVVALCDVDNPLLGEAGAARVFGPQKGADAAAVELLEARLGAFAARYPHVDPALPGAGAAGGLGPLRWFPW